MSNKRLIDGESLLEWLEICEVDSQASTSEYDIGMWAAFTKVSRKLRSGEFDESIPNQGEAARQEEKVRELVEYTRRQNMADEYQLGYKTGVFNTLETLGITIPGITDGGEQE